jgi:thiosulfate dehydrogenase [quinone] large subunit
MNPTTVKLFERGSIVLSATALAVAFISLPHTQPAGWGWFVFATILFALGSVAVAFRVHHRNGQTREGNFFFNHVNASVFWLAVRVYLGSVWLQAGLEKLLDPGWTHGGLALKGFWGWATLGQQGPHPEVAYAWYRGLLSFLLVHHAYPWMAWVIAVSELTIGVLLIVGLFTGLAAFAGGSLNLLYLAAGSASTNPVMLILSLFLLMAWRVGGYYGLDRVLLPAIMDRLRSRRANRATGEAVTNIALQQAALHVNEVHGFE